MSEQTKQDGQDLRETEVQPRNEEPAGQPGLQQDSPHPGGTDDQPVAAGPVGQPGAQLNVSDIHPGAGGPEVLWEPAWEGTPPPPADSQEEKEGEVIQVESFN